MAASLVFLPGLGTDERFLRRQQLRWIMHADIETAAAMLARTPIVLRAMLGGVGADWAESTYGPGTWCAKEVLAHLVFGERTDWIPRARHILTHGDTLPFEPFDRAGHTPLAQGHSLAELLDIFQRERADGLAALRSMGLSEADLERRGRHPTLGPVTLGQLLATWVVHDLNHTAQIAKALAFQLKDHVGPWETYLSILAPPNPR
jgi:hypothetical protein